jgi:alpha-L-fucosidase
LIDDYNQIYERNLPKTKAEVAKFDWDCVMTVPENQWGYHKDWSLTYVKDAYDLIQLLVEANSKGGNLVINFGPDGKGNIRKEEAQLATQIGDWMGKYSEAVYGAYSCSLEEQKWGYYTQSENGDNMYLIVFNKPVNNKVRVKLPKAKEVENVTIIYSAEFVETKNKGEVKYGGRDKEGFYYYDIILPANYKNVTEPFVIKINIKS